ncbi:MULTISPECIES: hypothetical protein [unclassified Isoptericola]|uniref:hypothetical protein n=1 Tax=unclassified Isoptericola TaxID=2623355 RepID=UPI0035EE649F|nr:hypothetical protein [Isoptericola sp. QY 916]
MRTRASTFMLVGGILLAVLGAVVSVVFFMQPWRTCPDDDVPAACPMLPLDASIMTTAMVVTLFATAVAIAGAAGKRRIMH